MQEIQISIVIANWNTKDLVMGCLRSIYENEPKFTYEVIVVDNGSSDDSVQQIEAHFPSVGIIKNHKNSGFAKAANQGIIHGKGKYILLLNSDTLVLPESIDAIINYAEHNSNVGIVGGKLLNTDRSFQASYNDFPTLASELLTLFGLNRIFYSPYHPSYPPEKSHADQLCDWVGGAFMLARKQAIDEVGLLDEVYYMYNEDTDWCYRMNLKGWEVHYCSCAEIIHLGGGSARRKSSKQLIYLYQSKSIYLKKYVSPISSRIFRTALKIYAIIKIITLFISKVLNSPRSKDIQIYWDLFRWDFV